MRMGCRRFTEFSYFVAFEVAIVHRYDVQTGDTLLQVMSIHPAAALGCEHIPNKWCFCDLAQA